MLLATFGNFQIKLTFIAVAFSCTLSPIWIAEPKCIKFFHYNDLNSQSNC